MTDQLKQALERFNRQKTAMPDELVLARAARAWLEFPSDVQVEAAAKTWAQMNNHRWHLATEGIRAQMLDVARAALEAARNHTNRKEAK